MTLSLTEALPVAMPEEAKVRIYCTTDPERLRQVSGVLTESQAKRRLRILQQTLRLDTYELLPVTTDKRAR